MPFAVVRTPRSCSRSTLLERSTLCLSWLFPPAAPLFRFSIGCCSITVRIFVLCRLVVARHAIGAFDRPSGSKLQQSVARCSGREARVHAPLRAASDPCAASARDIFADPRTEWRRGLADGRHSRALGRGHLHESKQEQLRLEGHQLPSTMRESRIWHSRTKLLNFRNHLRPDCTPFASDSREGYKIRGETRGLLQGRAFLESANTLIEIEGRPLSCAHADRKQQLALACGIDGDCATIWSRLIVARRKSGHGETMGEPFLSIIASLGR